MIMDAMDSVGMFDAKTHFSEIVERVAREGRAVTVTRRGRPVVRICPIEPDDTQERRTRALAALAELRGKVTKSPVAELIASTREGRR